MLDNINVNVFIINTVVSPRPVHQNHNYFMYHPISAQKKKKTLWNLKMIQPVFISWTPFGSFHTGYLCFQKLKFSFIYPVVYEPTWHSFVIEHRMFMNLMSILQYFRVGQMIEPKVGHRSSLTQRHNSEKVGLVSFAITLVGNWLSLKFMYKKNIHTFFPSCPLLVFQLLWFRIMWCINVCFFLLQSFIRLLPKILLKIY